MPPQINLLTKERIHILQRTNVLKQINKGLLTILTATLAAFAITFFANSSLAEYNASTTPANLPPISREELTKKINEINTYIKTIDQYHNRPLIFSELLDTIAKTIPENAYLTSFTLNPKNELRISGFAATRNDVVLIEKNLKELPILTNILSPLDNLLKPNNINFEFTAQINQKK